jgi:hypothetical protein
MYLLWMNFILGLFVIASFIASFFIVRHLFKEGNHVTEKRFFGFFVVFYILFYLSSALVRKIYLGDSYFSKDSKIYNHYQTKELYINPDALDKNCKSEIATDHSVYFYGNWQVTNKEAKLVCKRGVDNYGSITIRTIDSKEESAPYYNKRIYESDKNYQLLYKKDKFSIYEKINKKNSFPEKYILYTNDSDVIYIEYTFRDDSDERYYHLYRNIDEALR